MWLEMKVWKVEVNHLKKNNLQRCTNLSEGNLTPHFWAPKGMKKRAFGPPLWTSESQSLAIFADSHWGDQPLSLIPPGGINRFPGFPSGGIGSRPYFGFHFDHLGPHFAASKLLQASKTWGNRPLSWNAPKVLQIYYLPGRLLTMPRNSLLAQGLEKY